MEPNEHSTEETILQLYEGLHNPYVEDPNLIGNQLIEIYSNPECNVIPILFDIFSNHPKIIFRKQASIGLRICIKECFKQFEEDTIQQIWNVFFQIFLSEQNDELIQFLINPAVDLFVQARIHYHLGIESFGIFDFLQSLAGENFVRCLQISAIFLRESINIEKDFYEFILHLLDQSFQYPEKYEIIKEIVFISKLLLSSDQIDDNIKDEISIQLSQLFTDLLTDIDEFKYQMIVQFYPILIDDIQPFKMEIIVGSVFQVLFNQEIEIKYRYHVAYIFSLILKSDNTKFDLEDILSLFKMSINMSVLLFDISENQSDPDSIAISDLILECLLRIPNQEVQNIVITTFQCLIGQEETEEFDFESFSLFAKIFTALLLVQSAITRSAYLFIDFIPHIAEFCIECFEANNIPIQNISSTLFTDNITLFASHISPKVLEIAESILTKIDNFYQSLNKPDAYDYTSGFSVLQSILHQFPTEICDQLFDPIFTECMKIIDSIPLTIQMQKSNEYVHHFNLVFESWVLLAEIFRNVSDVVVNSYFDEIFPLSINIISTFYETQLQRQEQNYELLDYTDIQYANIELIGSLSISCSSNLSNQFDDVAQLLIELLQFQVQNYLDGNTNDLLLVQSLFHCLGMFVTNMTNQMSQYVDALLPMVLEFLKSVIENEENDEDEIQKYATPEMIFTKKIYFSDHFSSPSIDFIENVLESMPEKVQNEVMIVDLVTIIIHSLKSNSKKETLSSISLLIQFFKFLAVLSKSSDPQEAMDYLNVVKMFITLIYEKLTEEIDNLYTNDDYKILFNWMECIKIIYIHFKIDAFIIEEEGQEKCYIFDIFDTLLDLASSIYQDEEEGKLRFVEDLHDHIENLLVIIVKYYGQEDYSNFEQFVPKLLPFFEEENLYFHTFSINILSSIIIESSIIDDELIYQLFEKSIKSIEEDDPLFSRYFAFFLSNLRFNYGALLIENNEKIIRLIDQTISNNNDFSKSSNIILNEYLVALFASIDRCFLDHGEVNAVTDLQRFAWFVSRLPLEYSLKDNNQIVYGYIIAHYNQFPELKDDAFKLFCMIFISPNAIAGSFLPREIVHVIYEIIIDSKIVDDQEAISAIFEENAEVIELFYATMNKLFELFSSIETESN